MVHIFGGGINPKPPDLRGERLVATSRPSGHIFYDGEQVGDTVQCVHCQRHVIVVAGSGKQRGYCMNCQGVLCDNPRCHRDCINWEKRLDLFEAGKIPEL